MMSVHSMRGYAVLHGNSAWPMLGASSFNATLAALTPEQVAEIVFPQAQVRGSAGHSAADRALIVQAAQVGQMVNARGTPAYIPGTAECAATGQSGNVKLAQVSGQLALTGINIAAATSTAVAASIGAALGPATLGISTLIGLFPLLFGHHAAAVKREQSILCSAVPAANNYLQIVEQAVQSGQVTPQHGIDALNSLLTDFDTAVAPIRHGTDPTSSGECNAACIMASQLRAIVLAKQSRYQDLAAQQPMTSGSGPTNVPPASGGGIMTLPPSSGFAPSIKSSGGIVRRSAPSVVSSSSWLPVAALIIGGIFLAKAL